MRGALRGWLRTLPWLLLLGGIAASGWWRYFVAPRTVSYLWIGTGGLACIGFASELDRRLRWRAKHRLAQDKPALPPRPALPDWLEGVVPWIPLLFLLIGPATLTLGGARPRWQTIIPQHGLTAEMRAGMAGLPPGGPTIRRDPSFQIPTDQAASRPGLRPASPLAALVPPDHYDRLDFVGLKYNGVDGEAVEVVGRIHAKRDVEWILPSTVDVKRLGYLLYRYTIWCCVADAEPMVAGLAMPQRHDLPDDAWVDVRGRLSLSDDGVRFPVISVDTVELIPAPADPYLYTAPGGTP